MRSTNRQCRVGVTLVHATVPPALGGIVLLEVTTMTEAKGHAGLLWPEYFEEERALDAELEKMSRKELSESVKNYPKDDMGGWTTNPFFD